MFLESDARKSKTDGRYRGIVYEMDNDDFSVLKEHHAAIWHKDPERAQKDASLIKSRLQLELATNPTRK